MADQIASFQTRIPVSADVLYDWHTMRGAFLRLSPPWQSVELQLAPDAIADGTQTVLELKKGPFRRQWVAEHYDVKEGREFSDQSLHGPFPKWEHRHQFMDTDDAFESILSDEITYRVPCGLPGRLIAGRFVRREIERLFWYRHEVTRLDAERLWKDRFPRSGVVLITGCSGLVGRSLTALLQSLGYTVRGLTRSPSASNEFSWDPDRGLIDEAAFEGVDVVVHLAGAGIASQRWTQAYRSKILFSRVMGTRLLSETMAKLPRPPRALVCSSAVGVYPYDGTAHDESSPSGNSFLSKVCREWEQSADPAREAGIRVANLRLGVVLTPSGGALQKMLPAFLLGAGGSLGSGEQAFSWIGLDDVIEVFLQAIEDERYSGPINVVSPDVVPQREFARILGKVLRRPAIIPTPAVVIRTLFGAEMAKETLLADLNVMPRRLNELGYAWRHEKLESALRYYLGRPVKD